MDETELAARLEGADEAERRRVWDQLVVAEGEERASDLWLAHFAATDAPRTG